MQHGCRRWTFDVILVLLFTIILTCFPFSTTFVHVNNVDPGRGLIQGIDRKMKQQFFSGPLTTRSLCDILYMATALSQAGHKNNAIFSSHLLTYSFLIAQSGSKIPMVRRSRWAWIAVVAASEIITIWYLKDYGTSADTFYFQICKESLLHTCLLLSGKLLVFRSMEKFYIQRYSRYN